MRGQIILFICFLTLLSSVYGASIHGSIYDTQLHLAEGVVVEVNSQPAQRHISKYGGYSFDLEPGNYTISAYLNLDGSKTLIAIQNVSISTKGDYVVDLFADDSLNFTPEEIPDYSSFILIFLVSLLVTIIIILSVILITKFGKAKTIDIPAKGEDVGKDEDKKVNMTPILNIESADDVVKKRILKLMLDNEGKITQKEIRKRISLSEAKISQLLRDLEQENKIKKVKQGRINIIVKVS